MRDFTKFKHAIATQFNQLTRHDMFRTAVGKDRLWDTYLSSFPEGTNPIFRKRTEHDCSCCRQFIRAVGDAVAIIDGEVVSIWDVSIDDTAYQAVALSMATLVKGYPIEDVFLHYEKSTGTDHNFEDIKALVGGIAFGQVVTWDHFHVDIPWASNRSKNYFCPKKDIATTLGEKRSHHDVLLRSLKELTRDAVDTVLELIQQGSLYRGNEYQHSVKTFLNLKKSFDMLKSDSKRDLFAWSTFAEVSGSVSKIRGSAIGKLLADLSPDKDGKVKELEEAVSFFETTVMAPSNFKRSTALVSQKMVDAAKKAVEELGLASALERRYARLEDISVNNVIFADRGSRKVMKGGAFEGVANKKATPKNLDKVETVPISKFITDIVPNVDSIEVFMDNRHAGNLVSLVAPVDKTAKPLFKWDNGFSWSYNGDVTDAIKERVKKAGGNVTGDLCCRLAWYNYDDLDFHMQEAGGFEIYYLNKRSHYTGGQLDVDMNAGHGTTREPVENIFYGERHKMREGFYKLFVHQFTKRETDNVGFEVEIDYLGEVSKYAYEKPLRQGEEVTVAKFKYTHAHGIAVLETLPSSVSSKTVWGLKTQNYHKVNVLMLSPNHWDGETGIGNKHYFFMLDGCVNEGNARGLFNEFLRGDLERHRKVLEIVGSKTRTKESADQLSGLGFSDTKREEILVRVKGTFSRILKVTI